MKRGLITLGLVTGLGVLAITAGRWFPALVQAAGASSDELEGLANLVQLILWTGAGAAILFRVLRPIWKGKEPAVEAPRSAVIAEPVATEPPVATSQAFLAHLIDRYQYLDFRGMGVVDRLPLRLPLVEMYIPLRARVALPEGETWARELRLAGRKATEEEAAAMGRRVGEPQPVLDLLKENAGLVLLGDPGAGKTTFLKFLALALAQGRGKDLGLEGRLPILLALSAYATALEEDDVPLVDFIARHYRERGVALPISEMLDDALRRGQALLLLDGLDEVKDLGRRNLVVERVKDFFSFHRAKGNKFVLTSRVVGYPEVRLQAPGLVETTLVDFDDEEIESFVQKWTSAIESAAQGRSEVAAFEAEREREELLAAVRHNPGVRSLASNPLLLTILALMKRQGVTLPERRVDLYRNCIDVLLKHWNLARSLAGRGGREVDVVETLRVVAPLALWMQRTSPGAGLVKEGDLFRELERIFTLRGHAEPERASRAFLEDLREHTGLLIDRGARQFGFLHLTFQEYLAAVGLRQLNQQSTTGIVEELVAHAAEGTWREVTLLTIGYLGIVQQQDETASEVIDGLLAADCEPPGQAVVLAGAAVADAWPGGVSLACKDRVVQALLGCMRSRAVGPARRAAAGASLARLGDPRLEVTTLDAMQFCFVPAGPFLMGSREDDKEAYGDEKPQHEVDLSYGYWMARFPVTVAQWAEYCRRNGVEPGNPDSLRGAANEPVVWVSWQEAVSFGEWLNTDWRAKGWLPAGWSVRLPSEAEWEKAARGGVERAAEPLQRAISGLGQRVFPPGLVVNEIPARRYPWGSEDDPGRRNGSGSGIGAVSAVGCFGAGASPYGCEELSGNVWEWTANGWRDNYREETPTQDALRVVRGGLVFDGPRFLRCAVRYWFLTGYRDFYLGFRLVVSPFTSGL